MGVQYDVGRYLTAAAASATTAFTGPERGAIVYVETRDDFFGPLVVEHCVKRFPTWPVYVFGTKEVLARFPATFRKIEIGVLRGPQDFSALMFIKVFWALFPEEYVLMVQSDAVVVRPCRPEHFGFDMLGPVCGNCGPGTFIINGGLSLRRPASMLRALDLMTPQDLAQPEDVAFTNVLRRHAENFSLPSIQDCNNFAIESIGNPHAAIGAHGTDKYYAPNELVRQLLASSQ